MGSTFAGYAATAAADAFAVMGEATVYTPPGGEAVEIDLATWNENPQREVRHQAGRERKRIATVRILLTDVDAPEAGAQVERVGTGEVWIVEPDGIHRQAAATLCTVTRLIAFERTSERFRGDLR